MTSAAAMVVAILKVEESMTLKEPPARGVCGTWENGHEKGRGAVPWGLVGATASSDGGAIKEVFSSVIAVLW